MPNFSELTGQLGQKWQQLDPILKGSILAAGAGGVTGGVLGAMSPKPASPEGRKARRKRIISNAGLAAILAGGATAGIGYGARNLGEVMPKGSLPPGEAASKAFRSAPGRAVGSAGAVGIGGWLLNKAKINRSMGESTDLGGKIRGAMGDTHPDNNYLINHYLGKPKLHGSFTPSLSQTAAKDMAAEGLFSKLTDQAKFPGASRSTILEQAIRAGGDVDTGLLDASKIKYNPLRKMPMLGKLPAALRRFGPTKLLGLAAAGAALPELKDLAGSAWNAATGGSGEGEL